MIRYILSNTDQYNLPIIRLTTPVGWLLSSQMTILRKSVINAYQIFFCEENLNFGRIYVNQELYRRKCYYQFDESSLGFGHRNTLQYYVNHLPMADTVLGGGGLPQKNWEWVSHSGNRTNLTWRGFGAALHGKMGGGGGLAVWQIKEGWYTTQKLRWLVMQ